MGSQGSGFPRDGPAELRLEQSRARFRSPCTRGVREVKLEQNRFLALPVDREGLVRKASHYLASSSPSSQEPEASGPVQFPEETKVE